VNEHFSFKITKEIRKKVDELIKNAKTDEEKIDILNHWVAHYIRYSGLSMGKGEGYTLHPSDMIMRDRSGVCKDKASLLITFLRAAGFEAYPAMTFAGAKIDDFPADFFNHCVVALREKDGNFKMLDPTWVPWVREQWSSAEQEQQYLIGYKEGQNLKTTDYSPPENHYYRIKSTGYVNSDNIYSGKIKITCEGQTDARMRRYLMRNTKKEGDAYFKNIIFKMFPTAKIIKLEYQNPFDISKNMEAEIEFTADDFLIGNMYYKSPCLNYIYFDPVNRNVKVKLPDSERKYGFRTSCTKLIKMEENIRFSHKLKKDNVVLPADKSHQGDFASLNIAYILKDKSIGLRGTVSFNRRVYKKEEYYDFKETVNEFLNSKNEFFQIENRKGAAK
jgi:hypothetical protein